MTRPHIMADARERVIRAYLALRQRGPEWRSDRTVYRRAVLFMRRCANKPVHGDWP
jgi:hypothetical protein